MQAMTRADPQFNLRLPTTLRNQIEEVAARSGRSITAEIVHRLEQSLKGGEGRDLVAQLVARLEAVDPTFAATRKKSSPKPRSRK